MPQTCREGDIDDTYGISWGETNVGNRNAQPCPNLAGANVEGFETSGFAYRLCGEGGQWEESVDVTNCLSDSFVDLKNAAVSKYLGALVYVHLYVYTCDQERAIQGTCS